MPWVSHRYPIRSANLEQCMSVQKERFRHFQMNMVVHYEERQVTELKGEPWDGPELPSYMLSAPESTLIYYFVHLLHRFVCLYTTVG